MSTSRRSLLIGTGGSLLTVALAGCGHRAAAAPPSTSSPGGGDGYPGDLALVAVGAAFDALLVQAYDLALAGAVGPAPFSAYLAAARGHHAAHAAAWNRQLTVAGAALPTAGALSGAAAMLSAVEAAADLVSTATRLLALERTAAATALAALGNEGAVALAASIAPVEAQHVGVLSLLLGDPAAGGAPLTAAGALGPGSLT